MGCSEEVGNSSAGGADGSTANAGGGGADLSAEGTPLTFTVSPDERVFIDLDGPAVLTGADMQSADWELAFQGYDVFTNSGVSGLGSAEAFGPLAVATFLLNSDPMAPFLLADRHGGAFLRWYAYEGDIHALWSRYHIFGIRDGEDYFKVQILSYYGEVQGAPVSAIYQLRWAAVDENGVSATQSVMDLDGTAGGLVGGDDAPSGCIDLASGEQLMLSPAQAQQSSAWHLCFRRDAISVNGELGGPRGVGAVDLTRSMSPDELPVSQVKTLTSGSELAAFDEVDYAALSDPKLSYRGDRVISAFGTTWYDAGSPAVPTPVTWYAQSSDGARGFLLYFESFEGADTNAPKQITIRVKQVVGATNG